MRDRMKQLMGKGDKKKRRRERHAELRKLPPTERAERDKKTREARARKKERGKESFKETKTRGPTGDPEDPLYVAGLSNQRGKYNKSQAAKMKREKQAINLERQKLQRDRDRQNPIFDTNPLTNQERRRRGGTSLDRAFGSGVINQGQDTISRTPEPPPPTATTRQDLKDWRGKIKVIKKGVLGAPISAGDELSRDLDYELLPPGKLSEQLKKLKEDPSGFADAVSEDALKKEATRLGLISRLEEFGLRVAPSVRRTQTQTGLGQADKIRVSNIPTKEFARRDLSKNIIDYRGGSKGSEALQRLEKANRNRENFSAIVDARRLSLKKDKPVNKKLRERYEKPKTFGPASSRYVKKEKDPLSLASSRARRLGVDITSDKQIGGGNQPEKQLDIPAEFFSMAGKDEPFPKTYRYGQQDPLNEFRIRPVRKPDEIRPEKRILKLKPKKPPVIKTTFDDIFEGAIRRIKERPESLERDEKTGEFVNPMVEEDFQKQFKEELDDAQFDTASEDEEQFVDVKPPQDRDVVAIPSRVARAPRAEEPLTPLQLSQREAIIKGEQGAGRPIGFRKQRPTELQRKQEKRDLEAKLKFGKSPRFLSAPLDDEPEDINIPKEPKQPKPAPLLRLPQTEVPPKPAPLSEGTPEEVFSRPLGEVLKKEPEPEPPEPQPDPPPAQSQKRYSTNPRLRSVSKTFTPEIKKMAIEGEDKLKQMKDDLVDKHDIPKKFFAKASTKKEKDAIIQRVNDFLVNRSYNPYTVNSIAYNEAMRGTEDLINQALINQRLKRRTPKTDRRKGKRTSKKQKWWSEDNPSGQWSYKRGDHPDDADFDEMLSANAFQHWTEEADFLGQPHDQYIHHNPQLLTDYGEEGDAEKWAVEGTDGKKYLPGDPYSPFRAL